jgi:hypothetical protein
MKKALVLLASLTCFQSFALTCESEEIEGKLLVLKKQSGGMVSGQLQNQSEKMLLVGTYLNTFLETTYHLFDHQGKSHTFTLKKEFLGGNHCRTRVCPPVPTFPQEKKGKLSSHGLEDEYFNCL